MGQHEKETANSKHPFFRSCATPERKGKETHVICEETMTAVLV